MSSGLTDQQVQEVRERKMRDRRYFTVALSDNPLPSERPYRCWDCGHIVTTIYNEPKAMVQIKILPNDAGEQKLTGTLCRSCNIVYLFA